MPKHAFIGLLQPTEVSRTRAQRLEDVVGAELETVLYAQMLALFAPHAVRVARHLPLLLATLTSRQPALRRAAAATLRHFAERHAALDCRSTPCTAAYPAVRTPASCFGASSVEQTTVAWTVCPLSG